MKASQFAVRVDDPITGRHLLYSTLYRTLLELDDVVANAWDRGDISQVAALGPMKAKFLASEGCDEFNVAYHYLLHPPGVPKTLYATIVVTMSCNMRCVYCHEKGRLAGRHMDAATADATAAFLWKRVREGNYRKLHIYYYGGEPLLNIEAMEWISTCLSMYLSIPVAITLPTNAVLLDHAMAERLGRLSNSVALQLTLDGPPEVHDTRRYGAGDNFRQVLAAFDVLPKTITVNLRTNVDRNNISAIPALLEELIALKILPLRARWYAAPVAHVIDAPLGTNSAVFSAAEWPDAAASVWAAQSRCGLPTETIEMGSGLCGIPNRSVVTIDCEGNLHSCTGLHSRSRPNGNVRETEIAWATKRPSEFVQACRVCAMFPYCGGGCPALDCSSCIGHEPCPAGSLYAMLPALLRYRYGLT